MYSLVHVLAGLPTGEGLGAMTSAMGQGDWAGRCARCVLPRSVHHQFAPGSDTCNMCRLAAETPPADSPAPRSQTLHAELDAIRRRARRSPFDCAVGLSGGRDSTYLLYRLVRAHGLRCLAVYYRTAFTPDVTDDNVRTTARILGVPLVEIRNIPWELHRRTARRFFLLWRTQPFPEIANLCCAACKLVNRELLRITRRHRVPTLALGDNLYEEIQFLATFRPQDLSSHAHSLGDQFAKLLSIACKGTRLIAKAPALWADLPLGIQASLLYLTPHSAYLRLRYPEISRFPYFYYVPWREQDVVGTIQSELGWRLPPDCTSSWKADCDFAELKNYMFHRAHGATYTDGLLSNLVRAGQMSRDQALDRICGTPQFSLPRLRRVLAALDLPPNLLDAHAQPRAAATDADREPGVYEPVAQHPSRQPLSARRQAPPP